MIVNQPYNVILISLGRRATLLNTYLVAWLALLPLAAEYFTTAKRNDGQPPDPVARFHLGNGAELLDIHWLGDTSEKGVAQSFGIMVNYLYNLDKIEENHEAYATSGKVTASRKVRNLAATARKG